MLATVCIAIWVHQTQQFYGNEVMMCVRKLVNCCNRSRGVSPL